jgi:hypothetical protein
MWILLVTGLLFVTVLLFLCLVGLSGKVARERDRVQWLEWELKRAGIDVPPRSPETARATREDIR